MYHKFYIIIAQIYQFVSKNVVNVKIDVMNVDFFIKIRLETSYISGPNNRS